MGQPINQQNAPVPIFFQDADQMTRSILGENWVLASDLSPKDWLTIIQAITQACKPQLKYLPGFVTLRGLAAYQLDPNGRVFPGDMSKTLSTIDPLPVDFSTLCAPIHWWHYGPSVSQTIITSIFLSRQGDWLCFNAVIKGTNLTMRLQDGFWSGDILRVCIERIGENSWLAILRTQKDLGGRVLRALFDLCQKSVEEKSIRLKASEDLRDKVGAILGRIRG
jgi:hypothetical protein